MRPRRSSPACRVFLGAVVGCAVVDWASSFVLREGAGLVADRVLSGEVWRLVAFPLLHQRVWQILANVLVLWAAARRVEERWGTPKFVTYAAACAAGTAAVALLVGRGCAEPYLGASGIALGILVPYAAGVGRRRVVGVPASRIAAVLALVAAVAAFQPGLPVALWAAAGGGVLAGAAWVAAEPRVLRRLVAFRRRRRIRAECRLAELRARVDEILAKISREGMDGLTRGELATLRRASRVYAARRAPATAPPAGAASR